LVRWFHAHAATFEAWCDAQRADALTAQLRALRSAAPAAFAEALRRMQSEQ
jgi:hypothetical protein